MAAVPAVLVADFLIQQAGDVAHLGHEIVVMDSDPPDDSVHHFVDAQARVRVIHLAEADTRTAVLAGQDVAGRDRVVVHDALHVEVVD